MGLTIAPLAWYSIVNGLSCMACHAQGMIPFTDEVRAGRTLLGFDEAARTAFKSTAWKVRPQSDRMGLRLAGPALTSQLPGEMVSEGVVFGSVQVPPNGQPIVLLADRQTLGGYLKIGHVIAVDLPQLAQVRPGDTVRFAEIPVAAAQMLALELEKSLALLRMGVEARLQG